jgi:hypothetical protein
MNWKQSILTFCLTIAFLFAGNAIGGKVQIAFGATIGGSKSTFDDRYDERGMMGMHRERDRFLPMYFFHATFRIFSAIVAGILGVTLLQTAPNFLPNLAATVRQYPGQSGLWGLGAIVAAIALSIFGLGTLIAWKLGKAQPPVLG